jgi:hypothetical protein
MIHRAFDEVTGLAEGHIQVGRGIELQTGRGGQDVLPTLGGGVDDRCGSASPTRSAPAIRHGLHGRLFDLVVDDLRWPLVGLEGGNRLVQFHKGGPDGGKIEGTG